MEIIIVGLSHKNAPVEIREKLAFQDNELNAALAGLKALPMVKEAVILSTCNRVELYLVVKELEKAEEAIKEFFSGYHKINRSFFEQHLYTYVGSEALRHIIRVSASLDSMVVGETQIFGQVKEAYARARQNGAVAKIFGNLFQKMFAVIKRIRTETEIGRLPVSVSSIAVDLAEKIFETLEEKTIVIVGAGSMSELTAKHLIKKGVKKVFVSNRSYENAVELAARVGGEAIKYESLYDYVLKADIVIVSTGAPHFVILRDEINRCMQKRNQKPLFFIDISVPRNIDPKINDLENVYLYNIDDLESIVNNNKDERAKCINKAEEIAEKGKEDLLKYFNSIVLKSS